MDHDRLLRIRLLSERYGELQGLNGALAGTILATVFGAYLVAGRPSEAGNWIALLVSFAIIFPVDRSLKRYYASTFGRQVTTPPNKWFMVAFTFAPLMLFGSWLGPLLASVGGLGAMSLTVAVRDWPLRTYHLGATVATAVSLFVHFSQAGQADLSLGVASAVVLIGTAYVPIGFLDHRLLVSLVREAREAAAPVSDRS